MKQVCCVVVFQEHGYEDQLLSLALQGRPADMMDAARYYEQRSETIDKAVMLYHKVSVMAIGTMRCDAGFRCKHFSGMPCVSFHCLFCFLNVIVDCFVYRLQCFLRFLCNSRACQYIWVCVF